MYDDELLTPNQLGQMRAASYVPVDNTIRLNPELQDLPDKFVLSTVAHELTHRLHRKLEGSKASEVLAHFVEAQVWREAGGASVIKTLNLSELSGVQKDVVITMKEISHVDTVGEMFGYISPRYSTLPDYSVPRVDFWQDKIQAYEELARTYPDAATSAQNYIKNNLQPKLEWAKSLPD